MLMKLAHEGVKPSITGLMLGSTRWADNENWLLDKEFKYFFDLSLLSTDDLLAAAKMGVPRKRALWFERSVRVDTGAEVTIISLN